MSQPHSIKDSIVRLYSNNAYKQPSISGMIDVSMKGSAFFISTQKLTIVPFILELISPSLPLSIHSKFPLSCAASLKQQGLKFPSLVV